MAVQNAVSGVVSHYGVAPSVPDQPFANPYVDEGQELAASLDLVDLEPADVEELVVELLAAAAAVEVGVFAAGASWALVAALSLPPCHVADP